MDRLTQEGLSSSNPHRDAWSSTTQGATAAPMLRQDGGSQERLAWLVRTIEAEIIPRLMLAHQTRPAHQTGEQPRCAPAPADVAELALIILDHEASVAERFVEALRAQGASLDSIYLDLLAPAARRLGEMWEADQCDFTQVTVGLWRLQQVMYDLSPDFQSDAEYDPQCRRAMLVPAPGSQHSLGLFMVAEFFRRAGWDVWGEPSAAVDELVEAVRDEWFDLIGFSVGASSQLDGLGSVILALRQASRNPDIRVLIGGPVVTHSPEVQVRVGADAMAIDAPQALEQAERLMAPRPRRS